MIFAKIDVSMPRHYRLLRVRGDSVRTADGIRADGEPTPPPGIRSESKRMQADAWTLLARAAALGVWTAALCYTRDHMLDGFCPLNALGELALPEIVDELVRHGLLTRAVHDGEEGVVVAKYAKHNEMKVEIQRRLKVDRRRKNSDRVPRDFQRISPGQLPMASGEIPSPESESETESEPDGLRELPSQAPAPPEPRVEGPSEHQQLIAHFAAEFERLKGVKPVIGPKGGAGAKKLLEGRTLAEAKAIVDRALSDPWVLENSPDLAAIAGRINAFIGRRAAPVGRSRVPLQPATGSWKIAEPGK